MKGELEKLSTMFAVKVLNFVKWLEKSNEFVIANQLGRSGTSIGANVREAHYAQSKADFINKLSIALKEAYETEYWLELVEQTVLNFNREDFSRLQKDCNSLRLLLVSSVRTAKGTKI